MENKNKFVEEICDALSEFRIKDVEVGIKEKENEYKVEREKGNVLRSVSINPEELSKEEQEWWEKLKLLQCPFTWEDLQEVESDDKNVEKSRSRQSQIEEKIEEIEEMDTFQYRTLILKIVLVYEQYRSSDSSNSLAMLRETEALLKTASSPVGPLSKLITDIKDALYHVVFACRAYMQFCSHIISEVERTFAKIIQFDDLNIKCKAAISGVRAAALMEYGYKGNVAAMKHIETALSLDPDQGEWHFLLGKCMGRLRRIEYSFQIPSKKELKALEEAVRMTKNPPYIVFLAQAYREASFRVYSEQRHSTTISSAIIAVDKMNQRSLELYKEALRLRSHCSHMAVRCALGFMKLPHPYKDLALAKNCLEEALKQAPNNPMVNHTMAMFFERNDRNMSEAKKYYERASQLGAFGSYMDLLRVRFYEKKFEYDPIPDLDSALDKYKDQPHQLEIKMQMGSYHLFIKDDVVNAFKYWEQVIDTDPEVEKLKTHKCLFLRMLKPVNVYEVLCDESRLVLQIKPHKAKGNESLYRRIIMKCMKHYPVCSTVSPIPRRKMVLAEVEEAERARFRPKFRGRGRGTRGQGERGMGRGRGRYGGESGRDYSTDERGRGYRGGERGRGGRGRGNRGSGQGRGGYHSRDSSMDGQHKDHSSDRQGQAGGRNSHRNNFYDGRYSRDSSADSQNRHDSTERRGFGGSRGGGRNNGAGAYHNRDRSNDGHYKDKQPGSQNFRRQVEYRRDSSAESRSSCGSTGYRYRDPSVDSTGGRERSWRGYNKGNRHERGGRQPDRSRDRRDVESSWRTGPRERNNSDSSTEGSIARKLSAGRVRTDSTSSVNSCPDETRVDWKQGCRMSPSQGVSEDFNKARNKHFKEQHSQLRESQKSHRMWWLEQNDDD